MAKTIVGVDISTNGLRAVELLNATKGKPTLLRHHSVALPVGAVSRGEVIEPSTVATALKQLWTTGGFKGKDVVLGIGNSRVFARNLTVPKMSLKLIRESLPFQVQEMIPFPTDDAVLDFYPISEGTGENGPIVNGLLVAAVREAVLGNVNAVQLAGLNALDVDLVPFALSRVLLRGEAKAGTAAIIDVGSNTTTVIVSSDGVAQFVRIIPTGGDDLTSSLSRRLNISVEQSEGLKRSIGIATASPRPEDVNVASTIMELTSELITSLRTTLNYFAGAGTATAISRIVLSGGGSRLPGFSQALSEHTRLPVIHGNPLDSITVSGKEAQASLANGIGSNYAVALGLALGSAA
jgi:type IV pilus assembly protein PilM